MTDSFEPGSVWVVLKVDAVNHAAGDMIAVTAREFAYHHERNRVRPASANEIHRKYQKCYAKAGVEMVGKIMRDIRREFDIEQEQSPAAERLKTTMDIARLLDIPADDLL